MGLFTEDQEIEMIPRTEGSLQGEAYLKSLLSSGTPNIPTQGTAGLTPVQLLIQQQLSALLGKTTEAGNLATGEYSKILGDDYDPRTSPYYEGLRQESERLKKEGVTGIRQRSELGGMLNSSSAAVAEGDFISQSNSALLQELGKMLETERGRKLLAASGIQNAQSQEIGNVAAVGGIAEQARMIEQQQADALYNQIMQTILFPYAYQSQLATSLMNYSPDYAVTGGGMTDLGAGLSILAPIAGGFIGGGLGSMTGGGGGSSPQLGQQGVTGYHVP